MERIQRVENGPQWALHEVYRSNVERAHGPTHAPERLVRLLFHGTAAAAAQRIARSDTAGFLPLLAGTATGAVWGDGTYFARDAGLSDRYAARLSDGLRQMILAQVPAGERGGRACAGFELGCLAGGDGDARTRCVSRDGRASAGRLRWAAGRGGPLRIKLFPLKRFTFETFHV